MRHERWVVILHPLGPSTGGQWPLTMRYGHWRLSHILWAPRPERLSKLGVDGVARSALGFPRGEAVERSETDEEQRNVSITNAVRKKGTVFKSVPSDLTARYAERYRRSSSTPFGGTFPPGEGICPSNSNLAS